MRRFLFLLLPILTILAAGLTVLGFWQVRSQEEKMMDDLQRKTKALAESIEASSRHLFLLFEPKQAHRLVTSFDARERMQGCVLYDSTGRILDMSERIRGWQDVKKPYLDLVRTNAEAKNELVRFGDNSVYAYAMPVLEDSGRVIGIIEIVHDTSYLYPIRYAIWRRLSLALIFMVALIAGTLVLIQRRLFTIPILQLTDWFTRFQRGEIDSRHPIRDAGELNKLAGEVEQVALSLRVARRSMSKEAEARLQKNDRWTESRLRDLVQARLGINSFFVVSNREPYIHEFNPATGATRCLRPASGVVTAIDPILRASGGTWIAHGSGNADRLFVNSKNKIGVPPDDNRYILKRVWLTKQEEDGYYYGFSNEGLWPLCHVTHTRPMFPESDWHYYKAVNQKFADAVLEELPVANPYVFIQDYHFTLLGRMIKERRPDASVALFWHIPWPNPEIVAICPYYRDLLDGMLGCDLIGFHVQVHCNNFLDTANRLLECRVDTERFSVVRQGKETAVRAFPISVDDSMARPAPGMESVMQSIAREFSLQGKIVAVGVDRIDYTKGIVERILAVDRFLEKYPEYKKRFVFIQLGAPSRVHIKRYHDLGGEIDEMVEKTNWNHSDGDWKPILYLKRHFTPEEIQPFYALADLCIVSSLHDGMNLVAKEFVTAKTGLDGVLLLSSFTGAARELPDAVLINPYAIEDFADKIRFAVQMPDDEKRSRMQAMRATVADNNVYRWAGQIITEWTALQSASRVEPPEKPA
jgi:trehalose-6-phosphate synthase/HAMP domain-containing protein